MSRARARELAAELDSLAVPEPGESADLAAHAAAWDAALERQRELGESILREHAAPSAEELAAADPGLSPEMAEEYARFLRETVERLVEEHGSMGAALAAPGRPWEQVKKELGL